MNSATNMQATFPLMILSLSLLNGSAALGASPDHEHCRRWTQGGCHDRTHALKLKLVAIVAILVTSMVGVTLPVFSRSVPALQPDKNLFVLVKAFASGVILATGYMHVMPDSFACLTSPCLPQYPWHKFPFTTFIAMLSAVMTMMIDSYAMSFCNKCARPSKGEVEDLEMSSDRSSYKLRRHRVVAQVLELGIVVHSVVIGMSMGASHNPYTIRPLVAALCFHQFFEGMGLGGCILQAEYELKMKVILSFFFSTTTPFGIALGIGLSNVYSENSLAALIVVGILNAVSAGLLNYMALVDLLANEFMGEKLQGNMKLQALSYATVFLGAGGMSVMAIWA